MWQGFTGSLIRRSLRAQLATALLLVAGVAAVIAYNHAYFRGFVRGARTATFYTLPNLRIDDFVKIDPATAIRTGVHHSTKNTAHPDGYVDSQYYESYVDTAVGPRTLIVRVGGENDEARLDHPHFSGRMRPIAATPNLPEVLAASLAKAQNLPLMMPLYLDTTATYSLGIWVMIGGGAVLIFALWKLWGYLQGSGDYAKHPIARRMASYGPLEATVPQLDAEMAGAHESWSRASYQLELTRHWLVRNTALGGNVIQFEHLAWAYRLVTKRKLYYLITVGTSHSIMAHDDCGNTLQVQLDERMVNEALDQLAQAAPSAIRGYNKPLHKLWSRTKGRNFKVDALELVDAQTPLGARSASRRVV